MLLFNIGRDIPTSHPAERPAPLAFLFARFPKTPIIVASLTDRSARRLESRVEVLPWDRAIERYEALT